MRKGSTRRDWTTAEVRFLAESAGRVPRREICRRLKRSAKSVRRKAESMGLSLRVPAWSLVWCDECATWRTRLNAQGRCPVCQKRANIAAEAARCAYERAAMTPGQRRTFDEAEARRGRVKPHPRMPRRTGADGMGPFAASRAEQEWLAAMEAWQLERLTLEYDAEKQRLKRMREARGTNPRKKPYIRETNGASHGNPSS